MGFANDAAKLSWTAPLVAQVCQSVAMGGGSYSADAQAYLAGGAMTPGLLAVITAQVPMLALSIGQDPVEASAIVKAAYSLQPLYSLDLTRGTMATGDGHTGVKVPAGYRVDPKTGAVVPIDEEEEDNTVLYVGLGALAIYFLAWRQS